MNLIDAVNVIKSSVRNPSSGLPQELFYMISSMTPLVNVDLLIKDEKGRTLLSWRDGKYSGTGWHIPGGIVRVKETLEDRLIKVAKSELNIEQIKFNQNFINMQQLIHDNHEQDIRCHFISFLYECYLPSSYIPRNKSDELYPGYLMWHNECPEDLIEYHNIYINNINSKDIFL